LLENMRESTNTFNMVPKCFQNFWKLFEGLFGKSTKNKKIKIAEKSVGCVCQTHL